MEKDYLFHGSDTCNRSASERQSVMAREIIRITTEKYRAHPEFTNILKIVKEYFPKDVTLNNIHRLHKILKNMTLLHLPCPT
jgi:hypothetical protein